MEITLVRQSQQVVVRVDGTESHTFPFVDALPSVNERAALEKRLDPALYGARLFRTLFPADSAARRELEKARPRTPLQIIADDADLQRVPWEYLRDDASTPISTSWLALKFLLTRGLPPNQRITSPQTEISADALSVLVSVSDPFVYSNGEPVVALNVARERENLRKAFEQAHAPYHVTFVKPPTLDELHKQLASVAPSPVADGAQAGQG